MKSQVTIVSALLLACFAICSQAREDDCLCQLFLEGGLGIKNFVFGRGYKLGNFCSTQENPEEYCIDFCKAKFGGLRDDNAGEIFGGSGRTVEEALCGNMARDVSGKRVELFAQSCEGIIRSTGLVSPDPLCCRGTQPYEC